MERKAVEREADDNISRGRADGVQEARRRLMVVVGPRREVNMPRALVDGRGNGSRGEGHARDTDAHDVVVADRRRHISKDRFPRDPVLGDLDGGRRR